MKDKIEKILKDANLRFDFIRLPENFPLDIEARVKFHGTGLKNAIPTLIYKTEKGLIAVQRRADTKFDIPKLKKLIGIKNLSFATKEDLERLGLEPGVIPLTGIDIPFFIDKKVLEIKDAYGSGGEKDFDLRINTQDLVKLNQAKVGDFTAPLVIGEGTKKRVLSGMRATGRLHLGNYLGGAKGMLALQDDPEYETLYMVADMHGVTTPYNVDELKKNRREMVLDYLAVGLDPEKSIIFEQSEVGLHGELAFYLSSVVTIARMQHLPTYKEKVQQYPEYNTMALLNYPVLMAADILIYKADSVPVGIDQEPHLEVAREIARKMNEKYGTDFPLPMRFATKGEYVPSLLGEGKMSKSVEGSYVSLTDELETIKRKLALAPTDVGKGDKVPTESGVTNLLKFVELFEGVERREEYEKMYLESGIKYQELKSELAYAIYKELKPIQERRKIYENDQALVDRILIEGAQKARKIANQTLGQVKQKMGLD